MVLWWKRPDLMLHPLGPESWELRANSPRGLHWLTDINGTGTPVKSVTLPHDAALELAFRAIRDGLIVCSDPKQP